MCEQCAELARKYYPHLSEADRLDVLVSATAFPFGGPAEIEPQLIELRAKTDGSLEGAIAFAEVELDRCMAELRAGPTPTPEAGRGR